MTRHHYIVDIHIIEIRPFLFLANHPAPLHVRFAIMTSKLTIISIAIFFNLLIKNRILIGSLKTLRGNSNNKSCNQSRYIGCTQGINNFSQVKR